MVTMSLRLSASATPTEPVGFGGADGMPPQEAQEPSAMTAAALAAASCVSSKEVRPPILE